jgi:hypothetical protein
VLSLQIVIPGRGEAANPESRAIKVERRHCTRFRARGHSPAPRNDRLAYAAPTIRRSAFHSTRSIRLKPEIGFAD